MKTNVVRRMHCTARVASCPRGSLQPLAEHLPQHDPVQHHQRITQRFQLAVARFLIEQAKRTVRHRGYLGE
ncbi:MAG: hypothetical protein U1F22_04855 [Lysobacterales bacterium]